MDIQATQKKLRKFLNRIIPRYSQLLIPAALVAWAMCYVPELRFLNDKGLYYERTYSMSFTEVNAIQTNLTDNGEVLVSGTVPITLQATFNILIIVFCIFAVLFGPVKRKYQLIACDLALACCALFMLTLVFDIIRISDKLFATTTFSWWALLPVLATALLVVSRQRIRRRLMLRIRATGQPIGETAVP